MVEQANHATKSKELALKAYDGWVRERQKRPNFRIPEGKAGLKELGLDNFRTQLAEPRRMHLEKLKQHQSELATADIVALLVMMELPALEISTLLHKLSLQLTRNPNAPYFSKENQADNCGCGCGCGCSAMMDLPWDERINAHMDAKPFSIDPFNEAGVPEKERDALLIKDFLQSHEAISHSVSERVNDRYFRIGRDFSA